MTLSEQMRWLNDAVARKKMDPEEIRELVEELNHVLLDHNLLIDTILREHQEFHTTAGARFCTPICQLAEVLR